jgi:hypothetical protein
MSWNMGRSNSQKAAWSLSTQAPESQSLGSLDNDVPEAG